jgi:1-hydroxycarotenoid 3,4-desaturase
MVSTTRTVIVGAGIGGLACACLLAARGVAVTVVERGPAPGGKVRQIAVGDARIDAGPTVFTLRRVFEELFEDAGGSLADVLTLRPLTVLARHAWDETQRLDLFADAGASAAAIGEFAGAADARGFTAFCARARRTYEALDLAFMRAQRGGVMDLVGRAGLARLPAIAPFATLWSALGAHFRDPRLRQLFGRYATYCGSSPFAAPATLMLVAHVEQDGVWTVEGGMHRLAQALADLAVRRGAVVRCGEGVAGIETDRSRATGVRLDSGERIAADAVVVNADVAAVAQGCFGAGVARACDDVPPLARSLSAVTFAMTARVSGFPLSRHNVLFSDDYAAEFDALFARCAIPRAPTVYVCAQDRQDDGRVKGRERLLCLVNAPADGDRRAYGKADVARAERDAMAMLGRCGLSLHERETVATTPADFARLFPGTGGALYGRASHGWRASFERPGARTRVPGLYLAGGSAHPGPGLPMAALSGRLAAQCVIEDSASTSR